MEVWLVWLVYEGARDNTAKSSGTFGYGDVKEALGQRGLSEYGYIKY
jgi:hypothetical protein